MKASAIIHNEEGRVVRSGFMSNGFMHKLIPAGALALLLAARVLGGPAVDFDARFYLQQNPDVAADPVYSKDPLKHYLEKGRMEGRRPSAWAPR